MSSAAMQRAATTLIDALVRGGAGCSPTDHSARVLGTYYSSYARIDLASDECGNMLMMDGALQ